MAPRAENCEDEKLRVRCPCRTLDDLPMIAVSDESSTDTKPVALIDVYSSLSVTGGKIIQTIQVTAAFRVTAALVKFDFPCVGSR